MTAFRQETARARARLAEADPESTLDAAARIALARRLGLSPRPMPPRPERRAWAPLLWLVEPEPQSGARVAAAEARLAAVRLMTDAPAPTPVQAALAAGAVPPGLGAALRDAVAGTIRLRPRAGPPEASATCDAVAAAAWSDIGFLRDVALAIRADLRGRVLLHPPLAEAPRLSDVTLWTLIAATPESLPPAPARRLRDLLPEAVARRADRAAARPGWAGFWDQWALRRACDLGAALPEIAHALPCVAQGAEAVGGDAEGDPPSCAPNWRQRAPAWAAAAFGDGF